MEIISKKLITEIEVEITVSEFWEAHENLRASFIYETYQDYYFLKVNQKNYFEENKDKPSTLDDMRELIKNPFSDIRNAITLYIAKSEGYEVSNYGHFDALTKKLHCTFRHQGNCM